MVCKKKMHKLQVRDIDNFRRALCIHDLPIVTPSDRQGARFDDSKPWAWSKVCNPVDMLLFNVFTTINIGNLLSAWWEEE